MSQDTTKFDEENTAEEAVAQRASANPPTTKAKNIAGLFTNKKTRNIILFCVAIIAVFAVLVGLSIGSKPPVKAVPAEFKAVSVGQPPSSLSKDSFGADSPRFTNVAKEVDKSKVAEAENTGGSVQPAAVSAYIYQPTIAPVIAPTAPSPGYQPGARQSAGPVQADPAFTALVAAGNAAAARNIALWDAPRGPKMLSFEGAAVTVASAASVTAQAASVVAAAAKPAPIKLISAGFMAPVQITVALNSAEPGTPVVGTLLTGDYKGSTLIGSFSKNNDDTLRGTFTSMTVAPYGVTVPIQAFTLNPDDKLKQGIVTDVDQHLFTKYILKPSALALSAVGQALGKASTTVNIGTSSTVTSTPQLTGRELSGVALGAAAQQYGQDITGKDTETTVIVRSETVVGVVFVKDVTY